MILILLSSSVALLPDTAQALAKPFRVFWRRLKHYQEFMRSRSRKEDGNKYWEIDMTKFER